MVTTFLPCLSQIIIMYVFRQFSPRTFTLLLVPLNLNVTSTTWFCYDLFQYQQIRARAKIDIGVKFGIDAIFDITCACACRRLWSFLDKKMADP